MARAIVKHRQNTNPFLALLLLSDRVQDPELHIILQSVRAVRHLLWHSTHDFTKQFLYLASRHRAIHYQVYGPAGALTYNLARIGWSLDKNGKILADSILQLHLLSTPIDELHLHIKQAWMRHVLATKICRKDIGLIPPLDVP